MDTHDFTWVQWDVFARGNRKTRENETKIDDQYMFYRCGHEQKHHVVDRMIVVIKRRFYPFIFHDFLLSKTSRFVIHKKSLSPLPHDMCSKISSKCDQNNTELYHFLSKNHGCFYNNILYICKKRYTRKYTKKVNYNSKIILSYIL